MLVMERVCKNKSSYDFLDINRPLLTGIDRLKPVLIAGMYEY